MSDKNPIHSDADRPAALRYGGLSTSCSTMRGAVTFWRKLPDEMKKTSTIVVSGTAREYRAAEIERLLL